MAIATINWPSTVVVTPLVDGYQEEPQSAALRTEMDMGQAKQRRRFTAVSDYIQCKFIVSKAALEFFRAFWITDLKGGTLPFNWTHPTRKVPCVARFMGAYQVAVKDQWRVVSLRVEILPSASYTPSTLGLNGIAAYLPVFSADGGAAPLALDSNYALTIQSADQSINAVPMAGDYTIPFVLASGMTVGIPINLGV